MEEVAPEVISKFKAFDKNADGVISRQEFGEVLSKLDASWTSHRLDCLFSTVDTDGSGVIDYQEFVQWSFKETADSDVFGADAKYLGDVILAEGDTKASILGYEKAGVAESAEQEEECITLQIQLMSGDPLLADAKVPLGSTIASVRKLATNRLRESATDAHNEVSALVSAEVGDMLDDSTVKDAGLVDGSILTAVIAEEVDELQQLETLFHGLIMDRMNCRGNPSVLTDEGFVFPSLEKYMENKGNSWLPVPGLCGGFSTLIVKDKASSLKLVTESWSRVCEGSGQRHEITVADGVKLVATGFV